MVFLIIATAVTCFLFAARAWFATRDIYHPMVLFTPALLFLYVAQPALLMASASNEAFFTQQQLFEIQGMYLLGVIALAFGASQNESSTIGPKHLPPNAFQFDSRRLRKVGITIGSIGLGIWFYTIISVGGFQAAFSQSYGGGWNDSGYIRDIALFLPFCALLIMLYLCGLTSASFGNVLLAIIFGLPLLAQGLLGARRGPTFMLAAVCLCAYDLGRGRRPRLSKGLVGGAFVAALLILLYTNRGNIYIGSSQYIDTGKISSFFDIGSGSEYVVGGANILHVWDTGRIAWGSNWLAEVVVRPIPHEMWPTKWTDWASWTGQGVIGADFQTSSADTINWTPPSGSAAGIVGETYQEWGWLYLPILWGVGRFYAMAWDRARSRQGNWQIYYAVFVAVSIYLILQGPTDTIYRLVLIIGLLSIALRYTKPVNHRWRRGHRTANWSAARVSEADIAYAVASAGVSGPRRMFTAHQGNRNR
jgi:hypothetical protein